MPEDKPTTTSQTYEEATALASILQTSDPIHYNPSYSYRNSPYRHLHHQNGTIGTFHVRLLEAKNLKRNSWNLLGLGPVKHLGLSRAHGQVSSYGVFRLGFRSRQGEDNKDIDIAMSGVASSYNRGGGRGVGMAKAQSASVSSSHYTTDSSHSSSLWGNESIASAVSSSVTMPPPPPPAQPSMSTSAMYPDHASDTNMASLAQSQTTPSINTSTGTTKNMNTTYYSKAYRSTVIPSNSNPKWPMVQTQSNTSNFRMDLHKAMPRDGMEIFLEVQMREETTAADAMVGHVPVFKGGDDLLGEAEFNITELILRGFGDMGHALGLPGTGMGLSNNSHSHSHTGNTFMEEKEEVVDVWDQWISLDVRGGGTATTSTAAKGGGANNDENESGTDVDAKELLSPQVRILISYEPNGFHPRRGDVVALESFARRPISACKSRPILSPTHPLRVKDIRGEYLLCTFDMNLPNGMDSRMNVVSGNMNGHGYGTTSKYRSKKQQRIGSIRLHRNTIFVIERTNIVDSAVNVALKPADVVLSTPLGKEVSDVVQPYVESAGDLLMPAVLSAKLMMEAAKVGGGAFVVGLKSAAAAVAESQDPEKRRRSRRRRTYSD